MRLRGPVAVLTLCTALVSVAAYVPSASGRRVQPAFAPRSSALGARARFKHEATSTKDDADPIKSEIKAVKAQEERQNALSQAPEVEEAAELPRGLIAAAGVTFVTVVGGLGFAILGAIASAKGVSVGEYLQNFDVRETLEATVKVIEDAGPMGYVYFALVYTLAELVALPAVPLTASSGYLFGTFRGTSVVLLSATVAASISFLLSRTFLRQYVKGFAASNPKWSAVDKAVGREGFRLVLLLRLSPLLPFALSNYLYGLSAVDFWGYFWGTFFGFMPGTVAYVYSGQVGREVSTAVANSSMSTGTPWYIYVAALGGLGVFINVVSKIAKDAVAQIEAEENGDQP
uniref:VTT domain-containing protein n=1 Tax=Pinguiococcus pyrenoidosus TaxID=172671 RepID=A0A7R9U9H4_9STRA|mmetsp:Transcript_19540/g.73969  ORF Transcript_19540/g.73969 Transcript_19540/m.73969 type:complete len:345 (+) Transcript_19540:121-1155(+)